MYNALLDITQIPNTRRALAYAACSNTSMVYFAAPACMACAVLATATKLPTKHAHKQRHSRWTQHMKSRPCTISITSIKKHSALKLHTNAEFGIKRPTTASLNVPPLSLSCRLLPLSDDVPLRVIAPHE
jgi:hypothetical protein